MYLHSTLWTSALGVSGIFLPLVQAAATSAKTTTTTTTAKPTAACSSAPYKDLLFLSKYSQAEAYCTSHYPPPTRTITTTVTISGTSSTKSGTTTITKATTAKPTTSATTCDATCSTWSSVSKQGGSFASTLCSCIETTPTVTVTSTTTLKPRPSCSSYAAGPTSEKCSCYYSIFCGDRLIGTPFNSSIRATQDDCQYFAGDNLAEWLNYNFVTGQCDLFHTYNNVVSDADYASGEKEPDAEPCRGFPQTDPWHAGCGCTYDEQCTTDIEGTVIATLDDTPYYHECWHECDLRYPACVALHWRSRTCTLYSSVTSNTSYTDYTAGSAYRISCDKPCTS